MRIVVTADTHLKEGEKLPARLRHELETADFSIHAGDWTTTSVYHELAGYGDVQGVYGNVDDREICEILPAKRVLDLYGFKVGIVHGHGDNKTTEKRAIEAFAEEQPTVIIFGHSHIPMIRYFKKQLLINPGSPTDKRALPYYSFARLDINEDVHAALQFFSDKN